MNFQFIEDEDEILSFVVYVSDVVVSSHVTIVMDDFLAHLRTQKWDAGKKPRRNFQVEKIRWKKEARRIWKWAGKKSGEENRRTRWLEEKLRTIGEPNKSDAWQTTTQKCSEKTRCTGRDPGKINTIFGRRASNKEEIKITLDQARKRFLYTPAGKDWLGKKSQGPRMAILCSLKLSSTGKAARHPFFLSRKTQGATQLSRNAAAQNGSARRPPWHPNFKRTKNRRRPRRRYMQPRGIFYGERLLPRKKFTTLWFPPASKGIKLYGNSGWEFSCCAFSHKREEPILQKLVEGFDINRANKWVQASQSLTGSQRGRSSARCTFYQNTAQDEALPGKRYHRNSARRWGAARATPDLRFGYYESTNWPILRHREALPVLLQVSNRETAAPCWDLLTTADPPQWHLLWAHPQGRYLDGRNTTPLNHRPSRQLSFGSVSTD